MKTKILITTMALGLFTVSTMQAQEKKHDETKHEHAEMKMDKPMYTCPMHADEKSEKEGKCSKCGMEMKKMDMKKGKMKNEKADMKMDMNKGKMKNEKGDMKMDMKKDKMKSKKGDMKMDESNMAMAYMCPMKCEGDKTYAKAGDCPKCGMALKEMKKKKGEDKKEHKH